MTPDVLTPIPDDDARRRSLVRALTEFFGLFAGLAVILYIIGGATILLRLWLYGFLHIAAVTQLPRELLITIGLEVVVIPLVVIGGLYFTLRVAGFWNKKAPPPDPEPPPTTLSLWLLGTA